MNFALIGAAGFVAPRHMEAIRSLGHNLVAAVDPHDNVGVMDAYAPDCHFFTEIARFERHLALLQGGPSQVDYVSICSPNYLHDAHIKMALRNGAHVICEKPLVINPWNLDQLAKVEEETGKRVWTVLQLRTHSALWELSAGLRNQVAKHQVEVDYVTPRGRWYDVSWKGDSELSGGMVMNIGVHLFDMLLWMFGKVVATTLHCWTPHYAFGQLDLEFAHVTWTLSTDRERLQPWETSRRRLTIDGVQTSIDGFEKLHNKVYQRTLDGHGFGLEDARPAIELIARMRKSAEAQWRL